MRISRRSNYWTGWWQTKYFPLPPINIYSEILTSNIISGTSDSTSGIFVNSISEINSISTTLLVEYKNSISESISITQVLTNLYTGIESLLDQIESIGSTESKLVGLNTVINVIELTETTLGDKAADIIESIIISDTLSQLYLLAQNIVESIVSTDSVGIISILSLNNVDSISTSTDLSSSAILSNSISDSFIIRIPTAQGQDTYLAYLLAPETNSVTNYNNYNFDGCTKFNGKYLFYSSTGLYEFGGNTDNSEAIRAEIETVAFSFGTSNLKQVPSLYLGLTSSDSFVLKVRVDGKADVHYKLNKYTNNLQSQKVDIGKGLIGRYFQFELITEASDFIMESIEFLPVVIRRKI